jgi:hypothetical protein
LALRWRTLATNERALKDRPTGPSAELRGRRTGCALTVRCRWPLASLLAAFGGVVCATVIDQVDGGAKLGLEKTQARAREEAGVLDVRRGVYWVLFAVLVLATGFCALVFLGGVISASGPIDKGTTRTDLLVGAVIFALLAVALAWLARSVEHHARTGEGMRASIHRGFARGGAHARPTAPNDGVRSWYRQAHHARRIELVWVVGVSVGLVLAAIVGFSDWQRTQETQHHGLTASGVVTKVVAVSHSSGRTGSYMSYNLDVRLSPPVRDHYATTVHTCDQSSPASVGQTVEVLVDPDDPGYAELPGQPVSIVWDGISPLLLLAAIGVIFGWSYFRHHRATRLALKAIG